MPFGFPDKAGALHPLDGESTVSQEMARTRPQREPLEPKAPAPSPSNERLAMENLAYYGGPSVSHQKELSDTEPIRKRRVEQVIAPEYFTTRRERRANREATMGIIMAPQMRPGVSVPMDPSLPPAPRPQPPQQPQPQQSRAAPPPSNSRPVPSSVMATAAPERGVPANDVQSRRQQLLERIALATKAPASQVRQTGPGSVAVIPRPAVKQEVKVGTPNPARPTITVAPPAARPILQTEAPVHAAQARAIRERSRRTMSMKTAQVDEPDAPTNAEDQFSYELPVSIRARSRRVQPGGIKPVAAVAAAVAAAPIVPKKPAPKEPDSEMLRTLLEQNKTMAAQNESMFEKYKEEVEKNRELAEQTHQMLTQINALQAQISDLQARNEEQLIENAVVSTLDFAKLAIDVKQQGHRPDPLTPPPSPMLQAEERSGEESKQADEAEFQDAIDSSVIEAVEKLVEAEEETKEPVEMPPVLVLSDPEPAAKTSVRGRRKKT